MDLLDDVDVGGGAIGYSDGGGHKKKHKGICWEHVLIIVLLIVLIYYVVKIGLVMVNWVMYEGLNDASVIPIYDPKLEFTAVKSALGAKPRTWDLEMANDMVITPKLSTAQLSRQLYGGN